MAFPSGARLLVSGFVEEYGSVLERTDMESGAIKRAQVKSLQLVRRTVTYRCTGAVREDFETWYTTEINRGVNSFSWVDWRGNAKTVHMADGTYKVAPVKKEDNSEIEYDISFDIEVYE
jgi:hypothetical protein